MISINNLPGTTVDPASVICKDESVIVTSTEISVFDDLIPSVFYFAKK